MRDREKPLQEATSANAQKLLELEQLGLLVVVLIVQVQP